jgi:hypothetical protein
MDVTHSWCAYFLLTRLLQSPTALIFGFFHFSRSHGKTIDSEIDEFTTKNIKKGHASCTRDGMEAKCDG